MSPEAVHAHRSLVVHVGRSVLQGHVLCFVIGSGHRKESQVMTERCVEHVELDVDCGSDDLSEPWIVHRTRAMRHQLQGLPVVTGEDDGEEDKMLPDKVDPEGHTV